MNQKSSFVSQGQLKQLSRLDENYEVFSVSISLQKQIFIYGEWHKKAHPLFCIPA